LSRAVAPAASGIATVAFDKHCIGPDEKFFIPMR